MYGIKKVVGLDVEGLQFEIKAVSVFHNSWPV
jgi:hypothetical protein